MGIYARQDDSSSSSATTTTGSSWILAPSSTSSVSESVQVATPVSTSLPRPFDSSIGDNFTQPSCPQFFNDFLSNATFQECLPFSLLLQVGTPETINQHQHLQPNLTSTQTSNSFFATMQSPLSLIRTLDAACHLPSYPTCSTLMSSLATQLSTSACKSDLSLQNSVVTQAYAGLVAYDTLYAASCLTSPTTGNYCYADAVSNSSAPTSSYIYHLPLGMPLPGSVRPACTECLKDTMSVFAAAAGSRQSAFYNNYAQAAQLVDLTCGPGYVEAGAAISGGAKLRDERGMLVGFIALVAVFFNLLV
jgi:hypothetical protein